MKNAKINLLLISLSSLTVIALAGSSLGTLAWYAYSVRVTAEYTGTAVAQTEQLQMGLLWDSATSEQKTAYSGESYNSMSFETISSLEGASGSVAEEHTYWWMPAGQGFSATEIGVFLSANGYTNDSLEPITARDYTTGSTLTRDGGLGLYQSPTSGHPVIENRALKSQYVYLPFVFRIITPDSNGDDTFAQGQEIWLTDATTEILNSRIADKALRIHVDNLSTQGSAKKHFNLNPKATADGVNYVAGCLDLNRTGYYDTNSLDTEYIYGDIKIDRSDLASAYTTGFTSFGETRTLEKSNVNGIAPEEIYGGNGGDESQDTNTTFWAQHLANTRGYTSYAYSKTVGDVTTAYDDIRKTSEYVCLNSIAPSVDNETGDYTGGCPIGTTYTDTYALSRCDMYVYLEGWDHSIVDSQVNSVFSLGLQFEINRV